MPRTNASAACRLFQRLAPASVAGTTGPLRTRSRRASLELERSSRYLCSEGFITFISKPHDETRL